MGTTAVSMFQGDRRNSFLRQRASGYFGTYSYMFVKSAFDDILYRFVPCLIFSSIAYNLINFQKVWTEDDFIMFPQEKLSQVVIAVDLPYPSRG